MQSNISNSCGGTFTASSGAALAVGSTSVKLTAGAITTPGASCTIAVFVTAATDGSYTNTTGVLGSSAGNGSASIAVLTALSPPSLSKNFDPNPILLTGTSTLTFNLVNTNPSLALIGVSFTDTFPTSPGTDEPCEHDDDQCLRRYAHHVRRSGLGCRQHKRQAQRREYSRQLDLLDFSDGKTQYRHRRQLRQPDCQHHFDQRRNR